MITKDNVAQYQTLFEKANKLLNYTDPNDIITDINAYFTVIGEIKDKILQWQESPNDFANSEVKPDPYFLILPNDEGLFAINADTRAITIPEAFSKSGIGVQGDELAEIVYFSIDRYFDTADLFDKEIFVQWENAKGDKGLSVTINKTLNFLPNKVVFGWPITKEITEKAGNVKFAVRFYERSKVTAADNTPKLIYSFSTLTATAKVNAALDFAIDTEDEANAIGAIDKNKVIYNMLRNSSASGLDATAVVPVLTDLTPADFSVAYNLNDEGFNGFEGRALFDAEAPADGMGTLSYSWFMTDKNKIKSSVYGDTLVYKAIDDKETRKSYDNYYIKNTNGTYSLYLGAIINGKSEDEKDVYKRYTSYIPTKAGYYHFQATNNAGRGNHRSVDSKQWLIAFAQTPAFTYPEGIKNTIIENETTSLAPEVAVSDNGDLSYQWYRRDNKLSSEFVELEGKNAATLDAIGDEGYYKLIATNTKNNDTASAESDEMRVTLPASDIPSAETWYYYVNGEVKNIEAAIIGDVVKVELRNKLAKSDSLTYQWYTRKSGQDIIIDGATDEEFTITKSGAYRVKLINTYNGQVKEELSNIFRCDE